MLKKVFLLAAFLLLALAPTARAYNPPPATLIPLLMRPQIRIQLPPRLIMMPDKLIFPNSNQVYTFDEHTGTGQFSAPSRYLSHKVSTNLVNSGGDGAYYVIRITGFKKDENPDSKDFRLTFRPAVSKANIDNLENYLNNNNNPYLPTAQLTGPGCEGNTGSHICLTTITTVTGSSTRLGDARLHQTIPLRGVTVEGNIAAPGGTLDRFSVSTKALAVGQSVRNVGGQTITGYTGSNINWSAVGSQLNSLFDRRDSVPIVNNLGNSYNGDWELNSKTSNPADVAKDSFSTPPEGKLWNIRVNGQRFDIGDGNSSTTFKGAGTIVFSNNDRSGHGVNVIFNEPISCSPGTRLAVLTKGDITFRTPTNQILQINCGAYVSLGGGINFEDNQPPVVGSGDVKGIFVARDSITLPEPNNLQGIFYLKRDNFLAVNPTVLLKELLKLVFSASG